MEPISALSLACNVLQLVEQAIEAARACKQIYDRGSLEQNDNLEQLAEAIKTANKDLTHELTGKHSARNVRVTQLAKEATETALELQKVLNNIKFAKGPGNGVSRAFKQTIRSLIKRGSIERLEVRLKNQEKALHSGLIKAIYISCGQAGVTQSAAFARLEDSQQAIISRFVDGNSRLFNSIVSQVRQSEASIIASQSASTRDIMKAVSQVTTTVTAKNDQRVLLEARKRLLDCLYFESLNQRQDFIETRVGDFGKTFQWIFHEHAKHDFTEWLRDSNGIYWINGLAASGKSSLLAFIYRHVKIDGAKILQDWAKPRSVRILSFFFYKASNDALLKTFSGIWRSLCYQLLSQDETLFGRALADENVPIWLKSALRNDLAHVSLTNFDLKAGFLCLLHHATRTANYFVLVDGLDEFVDDQEQLLDTVEQIVHIAADAIKICCSSRPETLFQHRLKLYPSLQLQDLTKADMLDFCERQLVRTRAVSLIDDIVRKAQGVFLWLYLVVNDLRKASFHDRLEELQARLKECPTEMKGLFSLMLKRGDPFYLKRPRPYLRLVYTAITQNEGITLLDLAFADLPQEQLLQEVSKRPNDAILHQLSTRIEGLEARILARTAGLVQFYDYKYWSEKLDQMLAAYPTIESAASRQAQFIHRTAIDFLKEEQEGQDVLKTCCMSELDAQITILRARAAFVCASEGDCGEPWWLARALSYARSLDGVPENQTQYFKLLDTMFSSMVAVMPDFPTQAEGFAVSAARAFGGMSSSSHVLPSFLNLAVMASARYCLFSYAYQKIAHLPTAQKEVSLAVFFSNMTVWWTGDTHVADSYSTRALAGIVDLSVPLLSSSKAHHLTRCTRTDNELPPCLSTITSPLRDCVLAWLVTLRAKQQQGVSGKSLAILEPLCVALHVPGGSEVHCWVVFPAPGHYQYSFENLYSGEQVHLANSASYFICRMSIVRQESLSTHFRGGHKDYFIKLLSSTSIELSPEGTERFFSLSDSDAEYLTEQAIGVRDWGLPSSFQYEIGGRVISANMSSFTEEEIGNLVRAGWVRTDDGFAHKHAKPRSVRFYESSEDLSEAEEDITPG